MKLLSDPVACCAPLAAPLLSDEEAEATAALFRSLADPARVRIVNVLATSAEPVCVCELIDPLGLSQPTVSHHLKKLVDGGLLEREQRGKWAYFSLRPEAIESLARVADLRAPFRMTLRRPGAMGGAWQGRREPSYPQDTGATEDAVHAPSSAAGRHKASF